MFDKNSDSPGLEKWMAGSIAELVHCKDCVSLNLTWREFCHITKRKVEPDFFCKHGVRREKEPEKEITRDEKLDAIIKHIEVGGSFESKLKFYRENDGKVFLVQEIR